MESGRERYGEARKLKHLLSDSATEWPLPDRPGAAILQVDAADQAPPVAFQK